MKKRLLRTAIIFAVAFVLGGVVAFVQVHYEVKAQTQTEEHAHHETIAEEAETEAMPGVQLGGAFSLTDHEGKAVTEASWPGKYKLVFFGFTHCPDICPVAMDKFTDVMTQLDPEGEKVVPLLISVDPSRDTPEAMKAYVNNYHKTIVGLTGTQEQVDAAVGAYKVYASVKKPEDHQGGHGEHAAYEVNHSGYAYFMSPENQLLELFDGEDSVNHMIGKIKLHLP